MKRHDAEAASLKLAETPGAEAVAQFAGELDGKYAYSKGSIRIPYGQVDVDLIARIAAWCLGGTEA